MSLPVMSPPSVKRPPMNIKPVKTKVYAQDRLQKYVKKTVEQMEVSKLKMYTLRLWIIKFI